MKTRIYARAGGLVVLFLAGVFAAGIALFVAGHTRATTRTRPVAERAAQTEWSVPHNLAELLATPPDSLQELDVALVNLLCAKGLPGTKNLDIAQCLVVLDQWAKRVKAQTDRHLYRFRANPAAFDNSEGYFRMLMMAVVVYEDFGVRYNPERIALPTLAGPDDHFFADSRDIFLHGLLGERRMGTCSSLPVLYLALGRRLGYPLKLVTTKTHLFLRWEDAHERFNLEATGKGMNRYDDAHFMQWPFPVTEAECRAEGYLKSLSPPEELAVFLSLRGNCLREAGKLGAASACYAAAANFAPGLGALRGLLASVQDRRNSDDPRPSVQTGVRPPKPTADPLSGKPFTPPDPNPLRNVR